MATKLKDRTETNRGCPDCGPNTKLIVRTNRVNGSQFLGCPNWPGCKYSAPIPESLLMELAGVQPLFDLDQI
jgi:ssDNA-binding Zn-finger/Zn-ribbon topoisomerase 1